MTEIIKNLFLGDVHDSADAAFIFGNSTRLIVNCTNHEKHYLKTARLPYQLRYCKVPVNDDLSKKSVKTMTSFLEASARTIHEELVRNFGRNRIMFC